MSLKTRLMLSILVLPLLLLGAIAMALLQLERHNHERLLEETLLTLSEFFVPAFDEALAADDPEVLRNTALPLLAMEEIRALQLLAEDRTPLLELGHLRLPASLPRTAVPHLSRDGRRWLLLSPLPDNSPTWLALEVDASQLVLAHYRNLLIALGLWLATGLVLWLIATLAIRRLHAPLQETRLALDQLLQGKTPSPLPSWSPELVGLAERVNALAQRLERNRQEMQQQMEQATAELRESMETIEVQNIELDMAYRRAQEANRVKSEFLANMSHEIRTPLNGIIGFCRLLGRSRLETRQREWLDQVQRACQNLLALVNDVLDYSRLEAGRVEFEQRPVDMVNLVDEVLGLQAPQAQQKGLELLGLVYDDVPASLEGDPLRIRQVLTNLVHNAIKFTEQGEVLVRVMVERVEGRRVILHVSVSDTGIGLSKEAGQRLFQAFHQAEPSHSRQFGGSGLGLSICRQLVEQMGGRISVESEPGQGATFAFTLPLEGDAHRERPRELRLAGETVLIEEPHAATRLALGHLFRRWGASPVERLSEGAPTPALRLLAMETPPRDPIALAEWQARLETPPCPTLLLLKQPPQEGLDLPLPHGGRLLAKPLARATLAGVVQALLRPLEADSISEEKGSVQLLAVDDNEANRLLMGELLGGPNLQITLAESGERALELARTRRFDLVLMDIRMPGMDGVATTRALRRLDETWARVPIIAVTAHAQEEERRRLLASGLDDVMVKPLDPDALQVLLSQHLGGEARPTTTPSLGHDDGRQAERANVDGELPTVDLALGRKLAGGRADLARELLERLAASLPESEAAIRDALAQGDHEALLDAVHALNGACRYCGTPRLGLIAESLETRLRSRGLDAAGDLVETLLEAMAEVRDWVASVDRYPSSTTQASASSASSLIDR